VIVLSFYYLDGRSSFSESRENSNETLHIYENAVFFSKLTACLEDIYTRLDSGLTAILWDY